MKITLTGYMGSGKSVLGKALASHLALPFIDLDQAIEAKSGYTISETIFNKGELYFRQQEREMLLQQLQKPEFVLATGGGTPCYYDNIDLINQHSVSIYLKMRIADLVHYLEPNRTERPLIAHLKGEQLKEFVAKHLFERSPFYEKSTFSLKADNLQVKTRVEAIKSLLL